MGRPLASRVVGGVIIGDSEGMLLDMKGEAAIGTSRRPPGMAMGVDGVGRDIGMAIGVVAVILLVLRTLPGCTSEEKTNRRRTYSCSTRSTGTPSWPSYTGIKRGGGGDAEPTRRMSGTSSTGASLGLRPLLCLKSN
jgi:hypothetical protein